MVGWRLSSLRSRDQRESGRRGLRCLEGPDASTVSWLGAAPPPPFNASCTLRRGGGVGDTPTARDAPRRTRKRSWSRRSRTAGLEGRPEGRDPPAGGPPVPARGGSTPATRGAGRRRSGWPCRRQAFRALRSRTCRVGAAHQGAQKTGSPGWGTASQRLAGQPPRWTQGSEPPLHPGLLGSPPGWIGCKGSCKSPIARP